MANLARQDLLYKWKLRLRKVAYLAVLCLLVWFLIKVGIEPWRHAFSSWPVLLLASSTIGAGLVIQAQAFRKISTGKPPTLRHTTAIWSASAVVSVVAPLFAGITTRTALLVKAGMSISTCLLASLRQIWMGLEYALLLGTLSLPFSHWPFATPGAVGAGVTWGIMLLIRRHGARISTHHKCSRLERVTQALRSPIPLSAHPWFILQVGAMSATYYFAFNGMGADFSIAQAVALSAITVILSLVVLVPNGLGIADVLWVMIATQAGMTLEAAVGLAILLRLSHLCASFLTWAISSMTSINISRQS